MAARRLLLNTMKQICLCAAASFAVRPCPPSPVPFGHVLWGKPCHPHPTWPPSIPIPIPILGLGCVLSILLCPCMTRGGGGGAGTTLPVCPITLRNWFIPCPWMGSTGPAGLKGLAGAPGGHTGTGPVPGTGHQAGEGQDASSSRKVTSISCRRGRSELRFVVTGCGVNPGLSVLVLSHCVLLPWDGDVWDHWVSKSSPSPNPAQGWGQHCAPYIPGRLEPSQGTCSHCQQCSPWLGPFLGGEQSRAVNRFSGDTWAGMGLRHLMGAGCV